MTTLDYYLEIKIIKSCIQYLHLGGKVDEGGNKTPIQIKMCQDSTVEKVRRAKRAGCASIVKKVIGTSCKKK